MLSSPLDLYCERTGPEFWSEPVNAATNLLFLVAAWMAWRYAKRHGVLGAGAWSLIVLLAAIGIGSGLFHTFATGWAVLLDVVPILLFELLFLWHYYRNVAAFRPHVVMMIIAVFVLMSVYAAQFSGLFNGSLGYAPSLAFLVATGVYHRLAHRNETGVLLAASVLFSLSLFFRTIDAAVCGVFSLGTHFLWHVLNAAVLYLLLRGLLGNLRRAV